MLRSIAFFVLACTSFILLQSRLAFANNLSITNSSISNINANDDLATIEFDISWENSWRDNENWDAAWIFIKYRYGSPFGPWNHATINYVDGLNDGHTAPSGSIIATSSDSRGVFLYRNANGSGTVNFSEIELLWDYGADGLTGNQNIEINVQAVEMVYVPQGNFYLGDGEVANLAGHFEDGVSGSPFLVTSEAAITIGGAGAGSLGNNNTTGMINNAAGTDGVYSIDDFNDATAQTLPAAFPKGYDAFYCMKYETTQNQYVDFLNTLETIQTLPREAANPSPDLTEVDYRYNITGSHPNFITTTPHLPVIFVEYYDMAAYADWAGLRFMTELEYEKACRGPQSAGTVTGEYSWGTNQVTSTTTTLANLDQQGEGINTGYQAGTGNAWHDTTIPLVFGANAVARVGIFSANAANTDRMTSGATYWGIMEMSGNAWERVISVGRPEGRAYEGSHGDGVLSTAGNANNVDWPGYSAVNGVDDIIGAGFRGGSFSFGDPFQTMRISSRYTATANFYTRYFNMSARFVRTAP